MSTPSRESDHDLLWQAFCYANDELTPAEAAAFEERLAVDQAACEAVARAVEVCETVRAVPQEVTVLQEVTGATCISIVRREATWMQPVGWLALGAAACLAAVMAFQTWQPGAGATTAKASDANLALAWVEAQAELPHDLDYMSEDVSALADASDNEPVDGETVDDEVADDAGHLPPSWMLAALSDGPAFIDPAREN